MEFWREPDKIAEMKPTHYKHTQPGIAILWAMGAAALITLVAYLFPPHPTGALLVLIPLAIATALFCSLTIQINGESLKWSFGPGVISKQVALKEIAEAEPIQNSWMNGWGIHYTRGGWLYNVSGMDAVQITLKSGKRFRLGTDEPEALTAAIREHIS